MTDYCRYKNGPTVRCRVPQQVSPVRGASCPVASCEYAVEQLSDIDGLHLAIAYVPNQKFEELYEIDAAFCAGTLFKALDKPFTGRCCK